MSHTFVDAREFKQQVKADPTAQLQVRKGYTAEVKEVEGETRTIEFTISTAGIDRDRDTVAVEGWDLEDYKKNPVVLFAHDYGRPPVGKSTVIFTDSGKLKSRAKFVERDICEFGDMIYRMLKEGYLNATSVGFSPIEWSYTEDDDRPYGVDFQRQSLLEYSVVPVPSNPEALVEARSKGISTKPLLDWVEEVLDNYHKSDGGVYLTRKQLEGIRKMADPKQKNAIGVVKTVEAPAETEEVKDETVEAPAQTVEAPKETPAEEAATPDDADTDQGQQELDGDKNTDSLTIKIDAKDFLTELEPLVTRLEKAVSKLAVGENKDKISGDVKSPVVITLKEPTKPVFDIDPAELSKAISKAVADEVTQHTGKIF